MSNSLRSSSQAIRNVSGLTLVSRILGLLRDQAMASMFGAGPVLDAFTVAFRIPNLARVLLGEGAVATAFLPAFVREKEKNGLESANELATASIITLAKFLFLLVAAGEILLWLTGIWLPPTSRIQLLRSLTSIMLPYVFVICLAAQFNALLNGMGSFAWPAAVPIVLNLLWLTGLWLVIPHFPTPESRIKANAVIVILAGAAQMMFPLPWMWRRQLRFSKNWREKMGDVRAIITTMVPTLIGLSIAQINSITDSVIAWGFARPVGDVTHMYWLPWLEFPLDSGTASALYLGQRLYQFPLGVFGVALGTVLFPLLAVHAHNRQFQQLRADLSLGLRLVMAIGVPASAGLVYMAEPLAKLFFQYGKFNEENAQTTATMIAIYGAAVFAFCGLQIIQRGYYAIEDRMTPLRVGFWAVMGNLVLSISSIWFFGGAGIAMSTVIVTVVQFGLLTWLIQYRVGRLRWREIFKATKKSLIAAAAMSAIGLLTLWGVDLLNTPGHRLLRVVAPIIASIATYAGISYLLHFRDPWLLFVSRRNKPTAEGLPDSTIDEDSTI